MISLLSITSTSTLYYIALKRIYKISLIFFSNPLYVVDFSFVVLSSLTSLLLAMEMISNTIVVFGFVGAFKFICFNKMPIKPSVTINDLKPQPSAPQPPSDDKSDWRDKARKFIKDHPTASYLIAGVLSVGLFCLIYPVVKKIGGDFGGDFGGDSPPDNRSMSQRDLKLIRERQSNEARINLKENCAVEVAKLETLLYTPGMEGFLMVVLAIQSVYTIKLSNDYIFRHLHEVFGPTNNQADYGMFHRMHRMILYPESARIKAASGVGVMNYNDGESGINMSHGILSQEYLYRARICDNWLVTATGMHWDDLMLLSQGEFGQTIERAIRTAYLNPDVLAAAKRLAVVLEKGMPLCRYWR